MTPQMLPFEEYEENEELIRRRAQLIMLGRLWRAVWIMLMLVIIAILVFDFRQGRLSREEILDCTVPGGRCYQENQRQSQELVRKLIETQTRANLIVVQCARVTRTEDALTGCVSKRMKEQGLR